MRASRIYNVKSSVGDKRRIALRAILLTIFTWRATSLLAEYLAEITGTVISAKQPDLLYGAGGMAQILLRLGDTDALQLFHNGHAHVFPVIAAQAEAIHGDLRTDIIQRKLFAKM